jgi:hypothetical protein
MDKYEERLMQHYAVRRDMTISQSMNAWEALRSRYHEYRSKGLTKSAAQANTELDRVCGEVRARCISPSRRISPAPAKTKRRAG